MRALKRLFLIVFIIGVVASCGCCKAPIISAPDMHFTVTRIDALSYDEDGNRRVYVLKKDASEHIAKILRVEKWAENVDLSVSGGICFEPSHLLYDSNGYQIMIDPWEDSRCIVRVRDKDNPNILNLYYAPAAVLTDFNGFVSTLIPLSGKVNDATEGYFDLFFNDPGFKVLLASLTEDGVSLEGFSDAQLATYAIHRMENYSYEEGNTKEEYDEITEKHFGRKITDFDNGMTEIIAGTDRVRATGWSFNNGVFMVLQSDITYDFDGFLVGDFYAYDIPDSFWDDHSMEALIHLKEYLLTGNAEEYPKPILVRVVFQVEWEMQGEVQYDYPVYKSVTVL